MKCLTEEIQILENIAINILNTETIEEGLEKEYSKFIEKNEKSIKEKKNKFVICVIVGISKLIEKNIIYQDDLNELLKNYIREQINSNKPTEEQICKKLLQKRR